MTLALKKAKPYPSGVDPTQISANNRSVERQAGSP